MSTRWLRLALALVLLAPAGSVRASGWHDYELKIAPQYSVFRANSFDVSLQGPELHIGPDTYAGVGPLVGYAVTPEVIFTRHLGVRPHPQNPSMSDGDPDQELFFLVRRSDRHVTGPLTRSAWEERGDLPALSSLLWSEPRNPHVLLPLLGTIVFIAFALVIVPAYAAYAYWPLTVVPVLIIVVWRRRRRAAI